MTLNKLLYATITAWELSERIRRDDDCFDAWDYLSEKIGYKNPSTLRKMCEARSENNTTKLGLVEAGLIMDITRDYRLLTFFIRERRAAAVVQPEQGDLFSRACRSINDAVARGEDRL